MRGKYIWTASVMTMREVFRRRIVILLLILIPSVFYVFINLTTDMALIPFRLAAAEGEPGLMVPARHLGIVFMGLTSSGFLAAFLCMNLIQRNIQVNRRLIICGYTPTEISFSRLLVMLVVIVLVGLYIGVLLCIFFRPEHMLMVVLGFIMAGFVYGSYGLLIGSFLPGELEGILLITLLANIDIGWLQNPIFYAGALNKSLIRGLPAFSDFGISRAMAGSFIYGVALLALAMFIFWQRMRIK